jgi:hypothetical protein
MTEPAITRLTRYFYYTSENVRNLYLFPAEMKPTIRPMRIREAKDFLVTQAAKQATLEGAPLSDLEKRMMYFTESDGAIEEPSKLNEEFVVQCDSQEYESRISKLLHHAHARVKKENAETARLWSEVIRTLSKGDHYLLVLWNHESFTGRPSYDSLKLLGGRGHAGVADLGRSSNIRNREAVICPLHAVDVA